MSALRSAKAARSSWLTGAAGRSDVTDQSKAAFSAFPVSSVASLPSSLASSGVVTSSASSPASVLNPSVASRSSANALRSSSVMAPSALSVTTGRPVALSMRMPAMV